MKKDYSRFIEYFQNNGFNTLPYLLKVFSYLPPSDRIEVLKSLVAKNPYEINIYNKLSMALLKNGEFNNAINLLKNAYDNNYLNSIQYQELKDKIEFLYRERGANFGSAINYQMTLDLVKRDLSQDYGFGWSENTIKAHKEFCNIMIEFCEDKNSNVDNVYRVSADNLANAIELEFNTKVFDYGVLDKGSPNFKDMLPFMVYPPESAKVIFYFLVPINDADVVITNDYYSGKQYNNKTDWDISNFLQSKVNSTVYDFGALSIDKYSGVENTVPNVEKIEGLRYRFFRFFAG